MSETNPAGPWQVILSDDYGYLLNGLGDVEPGTRVTISIRRATALPQDGRLPATCWAGDVVRPSVEVCAGDADAPARWAQVQAQAARLNATAEAIPMKAITVKQPWAWCIAEGAKTTENRSVNFQYRGKLLIHAGRGWDTGGGADFVVRTLFAPWLDTRQAERPIDPAEHGDRFPFGAVIAVAELADVHLAVQGSDGSTCCAPWGQALHSGRQARHLALADISRLPRPVPCRGALGLWVPPADVIEAVESQYADIEVAW